MIAFLYVYRNRKLHFSTEVDIPDNQTNFRLPCPGSMFGMKPMLSAGKIAVNLHKEELVFFRVFGSETMGAVAFIYDASHDDIIDFNEPLAPL